MTEKAIEVKKERLSNFFIPIIINKSDLEKTLNSKIDGVIFDDKISEENLLITVTKTDSIALSLRGTTLYSTVPLHIWVKKELLLGSVAAEGDITLDFETNFILNSDWTITATTQIVGFNWIVEPKANVLGFKLPIKSLSERILNTSKKGVTDAIDKQVNENFDLKQYAEEALNLLQVPILISPEFDTRFKFTPTDFAISPFRTDKGAISSTLYVQGITQVGVGQKNHFVNSTQLLPLQIQDIGKENYFNLNLYAKIPFEEIEKVALKKIKGEAYGFGKKKIIIEDIHLSKEGNMVKINLKTNGDYEGSLKLKGIPSFNKKKNHIQIKDIEFSLDTENLLLKSAKWLLSGLIINKLEGGIVYSLESDLMLMKNQIQEQFSNFKINEGVNLEGQLEDLVIKKADIEEDSLMLNVVLTGAGSIMINVGNFF